MLSPSTEGRMYTVVGNWYTPLHPPILRPIGSQNDSRWINNLSVIHKEPQGD